ncbi:flagellar hook-basal body complex protein [Algirhabdus cladophorae]|uniref:flagellar hook-basal body complex protein n=1 Tax=Algirhabdus cladophorae TaxID=3377108 RepID=UPI003B846806
MDASSYTTLTRQSGLRHEMQSIANNIANAATTGYRREGVIFSEFVATPESGPSVSMARMVGRDIWDIQGGLTQTGGTLDLGIEGDGYFVIQTPEGERLTRAGNFSTDAESQLVTPDGYAVLDAGGAPVFIPQDAGSIAISRDGTVSVQGNPISQIGLVVPVDSGEMERQKGVMFNAPSGTLPVENAQVLQGFVEKSNTNPVWEISRMIEVQRAYELGQSFLEKEDERVRKVLENMGR